MDDKTWLALMIIIKQTIEQGKNNNRNSGSTSTIDNDGRPIRNDDDPMYGGHGTGH